MDQREEAETRRPHVLATDEKVRTLQDSNVITSPRWLLRLRGAHGARNASVLNARPDLATNASINWNLRNWHPQEFRPGCPTNGPRNTPESA
eukprot:2396488-Lingulodinium_polyedra.AAC.1